MFYVFVFFHVITNTFCCLSFKDCPKTKNLLDVGKLLFKHLKNNKGNVTIVNSRMFIGYFHSIIHIAYIFSLLLLINIKTLYMIITKVNFIYTLN